MRHFVPWALFTPVGEWHFVRNSLTPGTVIDESFYQHHGYLGRETYLNEMTFPLVGVNIGAGNYVAGPLEDWCDGAVRLNGVDQHYAANGNGPYNKSLDIGTNNFILEAYVRTDPGHVGGVLAAKTAAQGYTLQINNAGHAQFIVRHGGVDVFTCESGMLVNDGDWHHLLVEYRRPAAQVMIYVDGVPDNGAAVGTPPAAGVWITNSAAFLVGKGPAGNYFAGEIEFLRVSRGTLADAATTIEELYDWQFGGPMLADFRSVPPSGRRDAGALELAYAGEALPRITRQPTNIVLELGMAGGARVAALNGTAYAWSKDAAPYHASTNTALAFTTTQTGDAGVYVLTVSNSAGAATSAPIVVSVIPEPFSMLWLAGCICMARRIGVAT